MKRLPPIFAWSCALASCAVLGAAPARAVGTVFFTSDGVTQATANQAGVPVVTPSTAQPVPGLDKDDVLQSLDPSTFAAGAPATVTSNWSLRNDTGANLQNLFMIFLSPDPVVYQDGSATSLPYAPDDIGLDLSGASWTIFAVVHNSIPVYYPAVSLGNLANGATSQSFPLHYVLDNPQVFTESFNYELGMPKWNLTFITTGAPIPEPSTACLVLLGLLAIAGGHHKRS